MYEMLDEWERIDHTKGRNQGLDRKTSGKGEGLREKWLGEKGESFCQERLERNEKKKIALKLYIETKISMDRGAVEH